MGKLSKAQRKVLERMVKGDILYHTHTAPWDTYFKRPYERVHGNTWFSLLRCGLIHLAVEDWPADHYCTTQEGFDAVKGAK